MREMKRLITIMVLILVSGVAGAWLTFNLRAKQKYDYLRSELAAQPFSVVPMNIETKGFLNRVQTTWVKSHDKIGPHSDAIKLAGLSPSLSSLIELFTYKMPKYSLVFPAKNKKPMVMGAIQSVILPVSVDGAIYVAEGQHLAFIQCRTNLVYVFTNDPNGLREAMYYVKKDGIEQPSEPYK